MSLQQSDHAETPTGSESGAEAPTVAPGSLVSGLMLINADTTVTIGELLSFIASRHEVEVRITAWTSEANTLAATVRLHTQAPVCNTSSLFLFQAAVTKLVQQQQGAVGTSTRGRRGRSSEEPTAKKAKAGRRSGDGPTSKGDVSGNLSKFLHLSRRVRTAKVVKGTVSQDKTVSYVPYFLIQDVPDKPLLLMESQRQYSIFRNLPPKEDAENHATARMLREAFCKGWQAGWDGALFDHRLTTKCKDEGSRLYLSAHYAIGYAMGETARVRKGAWELEFLSPLKWENRLEVRKLL